MASQQSGDRAGAAVVPGTTWREGDNTWREAAAAPTEGGAWLPSALAGRYRVVESFPARGAEADLYLVEDANNGRFVAKVYRKGIEPKEDILKTLHSADVNHVVRLEGYGKSDGRWWELLEYVEHASLRDLINQEGPKLEPSLVKDVLRELNEALRHVHELRIEHRDLKPDNVLVRTRKPLDLVLADFGIASLVDVSIHFTGIGGTFRYAPPEAGGAPERDEEGRARYRVLVRYTRWDYWSLGMMLVEMLTGRHPFEGYSNPVISDRLATAHDLDELVTGIEEPWRKLCRGLLRRTPTKRWGGDEVSRWFDNPSDPTLVVSEEVRRGVRPFRFLGKDFLTAEDLAKAFVDEWDEAADIWRRRNQELRDWLKHELGLKPIADTLERLDQTPGSDLDVQVFSAIYALDSNAPLRFRNEELTESNLRQLADRVVADPRAAQLLRTLYASRILQIADGLPRGSGLRAIDTRWRDGVDAYERHRRELSKLSVTVPDLNDERLGELLAATMPAPAVLDRLRTRAANAVTSDAAKCSWFRQLGDPSTASPAALIIIPFVAGAADAATKELEANRQKAAAKGAYVGALVGAAILGFGGCNVHLMSLDLSGANIFQPLRTLLWGGIFGTVLGATLGYFGTLRYQAMANIIANVEVSRINVRKPLTALLLASLTVFAIRTIFVPKTIFAPNLKEKPSGPTVKFTIVALENTSADLRSGPSKSERSLGTLRVRKGEIFGVLDTEGDWYQLGAGWIPKDALLPKTNVAPPTPPDASQIPNSSNPRSSESRVSTELIFNNQSSESVLIYWIDYAGREIFFKEVTPGGSVRQQTFATHLWRVRDKRSGGLIKTVVAGAASEVVTIDRALGQEYKEPIGSGYNPPQSSESGKNISLASVRSTLSESGYRDLVVEIHGGLVTIGGLVDTIDDVNKVRSLVRTIPGVKGVYTGKLNVRKASFSSQYPGSVTRIARRIEVLLQNAGFGQIKVETEGEGINLVGEVDSPQDLRKVEDIVRREGRGRTVPIKSTVRVAGNQATPNITPYEPAPDESKTSGSIAPPPKDWNR